MGMTAQKSVLGWTPGWILKNRLRLCGWDAVRHRGIPLEYKVTWRLIHPGRHAELPSELQGDIETYVKWYFTRRFGWFGLKVREINVRLAREPEAEKGFTRFRVRLTFALLHPPLR